MEIQDFIAQFIKLKEKEIENRVWELWVAKFPTMTKENYVSYEEMLVLVKQQEIKEEIPIHGCYVDQVFF